MKHSALFSALFGGLALTALANTPPMPLTARSGRRTRSRFPGKPQPAGSKLAKAAAKGRVGIW